MLIYSKKTFNFTFEYKGENFEVLYKKEWNRGGEPETFFEAQGNINLLSEVSDFLIKYEDKIAAKLEKDIELTKIEYIEIGE